jgi:hypothetical protein
VEVLVELFEVAYAADVVVVPVGQEAGGDG